MDVIREDDQWHIITTEHNRAHRSLQENYEQIINEYYFPGIKKMLKMVIANCKICKDTPIPEYPGHILHIDILITNKSNFLTAIDKFSKFALIVPIASRSAIDIKTALSQILNRFGNVRLIVSDNEKSFKSSLIGTFLRDYYGAEQHFVPPMHSQRNRRLGNKFDKWYVEGTIEQDLSSTVLINGRKVHKSNLR